jgi:hypothetical protein
LQTAVAWAEKLFFFGERIGTDHAGFLLHFLMTGIIWNMNVVSGMLGVEDEDLLFY